MKSSSKISIVIGSNYGDEGKGVVTSLLASSINKSEKNDSEKYVILSHGGMQRGHTAYTKDGTFVNYHALSSATHLGWNTVYGENFVFNLPIFYNESSMRYPKSYIHENCIYSTLFDMMLNCITEEHEHNGSVGVGVWETIKRCKNPKHKHTIEDFHYSGIGGRCSQFFNIAHYVDDELKSRGYDIKNTEWEEVMHGYHESFEYERLHSAIKRNAELYDNYTKFFRHPVIFECSQGLMLDEMYSNDENHSTPSHTGVYEPLKILNKSHISTKENIDVYYVTRTYLTRHGYGDFANECEPSIIGNINPDLFNVTNQYQGKFRYSPFTEESIINMNKRVSRDFLTLKKYFPHANKHLVITHADEVSPDMITSMSKNLYDSIVTISIDDVINDNTKIFK